MSVTDGMVKTPGVRQNNKGWMRMLRERRRAEAAARNQEEKKTP
jgi:hypothetical protein